MSAEQAALAAGMEAESYAHARWEALTLHEFHAWCGRHRVIPDARLWGKWRSRAERQRRLENLEQLHAPVPLIENEKARLEEAKAVWFLAFLAQPRRGRQSGR